MTCRISTISFISQGYLQEKIKTPSGIQVSEAMNCYDFLCDAVSSPIYSESSCDGCETKDGCYEFPSDGRSCPEEEICRIKYNERIPIECSKCKDKMCCDDGLECYKKPSCPALMIAGGSLENCEEGENSKSCELKCDDGYERIGDSNIVACEDKIWDENLPRQSFLIFKIQRYSAFDYSYQFHR